MGDVSQNAMSAMDWVHAQVAARDADPAAYQAEQDRVFREELDHTGRAFYASAVQAYALGLSLETILRIATNAVAATEGLHGIRETHERATRMQYQPTGTPLPPPVEDRQDPPASDGMARFQSLMDDLRRPRRAA